MKEILTLFDIQSLITDQTEENLHLDYKAADSLLKTDKKKTDIAKDVSAFANSDGGTIIYGVKEYSDSTKKHLPEAIDPISRENITKEWLEQVIQSNIFPRPDNIKIIPISIDNSTNQVIYVVHIAKSTTAHQASDLRYYRRNNFESVPMYDYEVRDIMNRNKAPKIDLIFQIVEKTFEIKSNSLIPMMNFGPNQTVPKKEYRTTKTLYVYAKNNGGVYANYVNCKLDVTASFLDSKEYQYNKTLEILNLPYIRINCDNTIREIKDVKFLVNETFNNYWPSRYNPILPETDFLLEKIILNNNLDLDSVNGIIYYTVHADNAKKNEDLIHFAEMKIIKED